MLKKAVFEQVCRRLSLGVSWILPARNEARVNGADIPQGPTGIGTRLLIPYLMDRAL